jgi:ABC-2 type transport system permease protein
MTDLEVAKIAPRHYATVNWIGLATLYRKEVRRFLTVGTQTVVAPLVTSLLFLAIFVLALGRSSTPGGSMGGAVNLVGGVSYIEFLAPGLIIMSMTQNAFANTSSSLLIAKIQGNIVDLLMPPLSPLEMTLGIAAGGLTRGLLVGLTTGLAMLFFVPIEIAHPFFVLFHGVMASLMLSLLGMLSGIWSEKFDQLAAVTNFVITPLSFLSGAFYSSQRLPEMWQHLAHANPFFYMIDGFRYGFIGHADGSLTAGIVMLTGANLLLAFLCFRCFQRGFRLKA